MDFARDSAAQVAQQVEGGTADLADRDVAPERRVILVPLQDIAEVADAAGRQRLDRTGRNSVDPDILGTEVGREVAYACLQRRFCYTHDVVMGHNTFGPVV